MDSSETGQAPRSRRFIILGLVLGLVGVAMWLHFRPTSPPELSLAGIETEIARLLEKARAEVLAAPRSAEAWGHLGQALLANQVFEPESLICFQEAERLQPNQVDWPYYQGGIFLNLAKLEMAVTKLRRAVQICNAEELAALEPRLLLAETLAVQGQTKEARELFQQCLERDPLRARTLFGLGSLALVQEDWPVARAYFEKCLGNPQARNKACVQLIPTCLRLGDKNAADRFQDLAQRLPKDVPWSDVFIEKYAPLIVRKRERYRLAEQLEAAGQFLQVIQLIHPLVDENPEDYLPRYILGRVLTQMGRFEQGEHHLAKALELAPTKFQSHYLLSLAYFGKAETLAPKDPVRAAELFEKSATFARQALDINAQFGFAHMVLGLAWKNLGKKPEALAAFRQAVHCNPEHADHHLWLGSALAEDGKISAARRHLEQAMLLAHPTDQRAKVILAKLPKESK